MINVGFSLLCALLLFPQTASALLQPGLLDQAQAALDRGDLSSAASLLDQVLQGDPRHKQARQAIVDVLMALGRWKEADGHLHLLRLYHPEDPGVLYLAAAVAFHRGNFEEAGTLAGKSFDRGKPEARKLLALSRYMLGDAEGFKSNMEAAVNENPQDTDALYHLARFYYDQEIYDPAFDAFRKIVELDPDHYKAHYYLGWCYRAKNDFTAGERSYRTAIEIIQRQNIRYGWAFADLGDLLILRGEAEQGIGWLYRATRNDPDLPYAHFKYASALLQREVTTEIEQELKKAIELDPGYTEAYYVLGRYYSRIGDKESAGQAWKKFEELKENPQPSPQGLRRP